MTTRSTIVLGEYERRRLAASAPSQADLRLAAHLSGDADDDDSRSRLRIRWLQSGDIEITATSWIGVVGFTHFDVHVVPKYVGGPLRVLQMLEYATGVKMLRRLPSTRPLPADGNDLFDLICLLLTEEVLALLRDGLLRNYRHVEDSLPVLRGRLRTRDQYLRRYGQLDQLECSFDEYDADTPENQLLAAALTVARKRASDPDIKRSAARLGGIIAESCTPPTMTADWYEQRIHYDRRNTRYQSAHQLAALILRGAAFDNIFDTSGDAPVGAFMIDMNTVFERFITRLVGNALADTPYTVEDQATIRAVIRDDDTGRSYTTVRPDLVITSTTGQSVPIDIKYKLYENRRISTADIFQAFTYAYVLAAEGGHPRAGIIYPAHHATSRPSLSIKPLDAHVAARVLGAGIDVPEVLSLLAGPDSDRLLQRVEGLVLRLIEDTPSYAGAHA
jgi:5-methylcytosine-specific restriction enzyme subunit McrC